MDEALAPFAAFVAALLAVPDPLPANEPDAGLYVESMTLSLPFEMDVHDEDGRVRLAGGPPTQYTETSFLPLFHRLKLGITVHPRPNDG